ncbi:uncharacterized protein LOC132698840 [Cylas formicarius]|uniref:uncharacterized protein LOC132698840 n=1 Tax=Cylas formicarius TaxID=197179 RepID=UPI0029589AAB|nr:uncharacterized protein LOC132698840 [Cylas formicarius]
MSTKSKVIGLQLSGKLVSNAVRSYRFSKTYSQQLIRVAILNIMYRRMNIDASEFSLQNYESVPYVLFKRKSANRIIRCFHAVSHGIVDAINKEYLKEVYLIFENKKTREIVETYRFTLKYNKGGKKSDVKRSVVSSATVDLLQAICDLPAMEKMSSDIEYGIEFRYNDEVPCEYQPPYFGPGSNPCGINFRDLSDNIIILGTANTGFHKLSCYATGKIFSLTTSEAASSECITGTAPKIANVVNIVDDSDEVLEEETVRNSEKERESCEYLTPEIFPTEQTNDIELEESSEDDRFDEQTTKYPSPANGADGPSSAKRSRMTSDINSIESYEIISIRSEELIECPCLWNLCKYAFETIECPFCQRRVHQVCHGYLRPESLSPDSFQCWKCTPHKSQDWVFFCRIRALVAIANATDTFPLELLDSVPIDEKEAILRKLNALMILTTSDVHKSCVINKDRLEKSLMCLFVQ